MEEKIFCGNGKIIDGKYGAMPKISMHKEDINKIVQYMKSEKSDWINLTMFSKKSPEEGKPTHYLEIDTWKPEPKADHAPSEDGDGLPF